MRNFPLFLTGLFALGAAAAQAQSPIRASTTVHPDGSTTATVTDPDKGTAEETTTDASGKTVLRKVTYLLDEQGQPIGGITYDGKGAILYRATYRRDGLSRIEEETISDPKGTMIRRRVYSYGVNNKVTNIEEYDASGNRITPVRKGSATRAQPTPSRNVRR